MSETERDATSESPTSLRDFCRTQRGQELLDRAQEVRAIKRPQDPVWPVLEAVEAMDAAASILDGTQPATAATLRGAIHYVLDVAANAGELSVENVKRQVIARLRSLPGGEPREVRDDPAESAYYNARTCICGEDASAHIHPGCDGFDPDWEAIRFRENVVGARVPVTESEVEPVGAGVKLIAAERARQVTTEGYDASHDAEHDRHELLTAATALITAGRGNSPVNDPWGLVRKHRGNHVRCLTIAGALVAAEIDRLLRLVPSSTGAPSDG